MPLLQSLRAKQEIKNPILGKEVRRRRTSFPKMGFLISWSTLRILHKITCNCWAGAALLPLPNNYRLFYAWC